MKIRDLLNFTTADLVKADAYFKSSFRYSLIKLQQLTPDSTMGRLMILVFSSINNGGSFRSNAVVVGSSFLQVILFYSAEPPNLSWQTSLSVSLR